MQGIVLKAQVIASEIPLDEPLRQQMETLLDRADVVIAQALDRALTLRSGESVLTRKAVDPTAGLSRWHCFRSRSTGD
jgi:hypothetical protein